MQSLKYFVLFLTNSILKRILKVKVWASIATISTRYRYSPKDKIKNIVPKTKTNVSNRISRMFVHKLKKDPLIMIRLMSGHGQQGQW